MSVSACPVSHVPSGRPLWSLAEDVRIVDHAGDRGRLTVTGRWGTVELHDRSPLMREVLRRMTLGPVSLEHVPRLAQSFVEWKRGTGGCTGWPVVRRSFDRLGGRVVPSLGAEDSGRLILSVVADSPDALFTLPPVDPGRLVRARPCMLLHVVDGVSALSCPSVPHRVLLHRSSARDVAKELVNRTGTIRDIAASLRTSVSFVADVVAYLDGAGFVATPAEIVLGTSGCDGVRPRPA